jgi:hypothetical protein
MMMHDGLLRREEGVSAICPPWIERILSPFILMVMRVIDFEGIGSDEDEEQKERV